MTKKMVTALVCAVLMMLCAVVQADTVVLFGDMHYGEEAFDMHMNDEDNFLVYDGEQFSLNDDSFSFKEEFQIYGGKTRSVYEFTIPSKRYSIEDDGTELLLGTVTINIPYQATLYVGEGNRRSGEYMLSEPVTLNDVYDEPIYLRRDEDGNPVLTDRVYLYCYEVSGEIRRFAATLFIDYEGYTARYAPLGTVPLLPEDYLPQAGQIFQLPEAGPTEEPPVQAVGGGFGTADSEPETDMDNQGSGSELP
ncbi:MAG: hypothetical protein IJE08_15760 [Clostridia bacterium]|nr:hypothetical protein [Clostridia bacterium]